MLRIVCIPMIVTLSFGAAPPSEPTAEGNYSDSDDNYCHVFSSALGSLKVESSFEP